VFMEHCSGAVQRCGRRGSGRGSSRGIVGTFALSGANVAEFAKG